MENNTQQSEQNVSVQSEQQPRSNKGMFWFYGILAVLVVVVSGYALSEYSALKPGLDGELGAVYILVFFTPIILLLILIGFIYSIFKLVLVFKKDKQQGHPNTQVFLPTATLILIILLILLFLYFFFVS